MNKHQSVRLQMLELIGKEALNYSASINAIPAFARTMGRINVITSEILLLNAQQSVVLTGIAEKKHDAIGHLVDIVLEISGGIYSYADMNNDTVLKSKVNIKASTLGSIRLDKLIAIADTVSAQAQGLPQGALADFGISQEDLSTLDAVLQEVKSLKSAPREATLERSGYTDQLASLFEEANQLLKESLDKLAQQFKRKDPAFYAKYKTIRGMSATASGKSTSSAPAPTAVE